MMSPGRRYDILWLCVCWDRSRQTNFLSVKLNVLLSISLTCVLGAEKNCLIETFLLSTHNMCIV